ncbi:MAG: PASTA domain-containing protein, partial [Deltaproteobacteria bacterium]|nr:PASTA domain-containing protein [Deltaproteobacteria bacterium]
QKDFYAIFVGLAPVIEPAIVIVVIIDEPRGSIYGGVVAAPVFAEIAGQALPLLGVPPSRPQKLRAALEDPGPTKRPAPLPASTEDEIVRAAHSRTMPRLLGLSLRQALAVVSRLGLQIQVQGSGYVFEQDPPAGQGLDQVETCRLKLRAGA